MGADIGQSHLDRPTYREKRLVETATASELASEDNICQPSGNTSRELFEVGRSGNYPLHVGFCCGFSVLSAGLCSRIQESLVYHEGGGGKVRFSVTVVLGQ